MSFNNSTSSINNNVSNNLGIFKNFEQKLTKPLSLLEDIDQFLNFLSNTCDIQNELFVPANVSSDTVIKKNILDCDDAYRKSFFSEIKQKNVFSNENSDICEYLTACISKNENSVDNLEHKEFVFLSPVSDFTDENSFKDSKVVYSNKKILSPLNLLSPNYLNDVSMNYLTFFKNNSAVTQSFIKPKRKLIDSPVTDKSFNSLSVSLSPPSIKMQSKNESYLTDTHSMWLMKLDLWFDKFKISKKRVESKKESLQLCKTQNDTKFCTEKIQQEISQDILYLHKFSKFFIPNNNKHLYDTAMLSNNAYNSRLLIHKETNFDKILINLHHQHFLMTGIMLPSKCDSCIKFIKQDNLQKDLKNCNYFKHYFTQYRNMETSISNSSDAAKTPISVNNFWSDIKRDISFKLKGSENKSINTIGSLCEEKSSLAQLPIQSNYNINKKNNLKTYRNFSKSNKRLKCRILSVEEKKILALLKFVVIKNNFCAFPLIKSKHTKIKNRQVVLPLVDETFRNLFMSWMCWYWSVYKNCYEIRSNLIKCNSCDYPIADKMDCLLFRVSYNHFSNRLCVSCKAQKQLLKEKLVIYDESEEYLKGDSKATLVESRLSTAQLKKLARIFVTREDYC
ncbi:hypothetical protein QEN19_000182 [Hanseniaspora menglaensis]